MKTKTFLEELQTAKNHSYAVGAFNIFNYLSARAVIRGAEKLDCPVILQTSTKTVKKFGLQELPIMLHDLACKASVNVIVHLDHCQDVELAKACIDAGWDSVMFDGSHTPLEKNIADCREIVTYAHSKGVFVEGELGRIAGVEDDLKVESNKATLATLEESIRFVSESGIDAFAPAIGTAHGVYKGTPAINFDLVKQLKECVPTPIVIHGGTGLSEKTFRRLICSGGTKVNISTAIKNAYIDGCRKYMADYQACLDPLKFDQFLNCEIENVAIKHMELFRKDCVR